MPPDVQCGVVRLLQDIKNCSLGETMGKERSDKAQKPTTRHDVHHGFYGMGAECALAGDSTRHEFGNQSQTRAERRQKMMETHKEQMEAMKADVEKMKSSLAQMKSNVATVSDPAEQARWQANVDMWDALIGHMDQMLKHMESMGPGMMGPGRMGGPPSPKSAGKPS